MPASPVAPSAGAVPSATDAPRPAAVAPARPAPRPAPLPVLPDGRHPAYLTDVGVAGATVEFDLLRYLATDEEREAYEAAHPSEYGGDGDGESPFRNDNSRLRRLPVAPDLWAVVQQSGAVGCDGPHTLDFAALAANLRARDPGIGRPLGSNPFWLTVRHGTVVALDEQPCAG